MNDDWAYTWEAKRLAETGKLTYVGWAGAMLGAQAYWAALLIKLFGFSFTVVRLSTLPFAAASAILQYRIARHIGLGQASATFATLCVVLSPIFTPLANSFMTDVPAFFFLLLAVYSSLRAAHHTDGRFCAWILLSALAGFAGGTIRQVIWAAPLIWIPTLAIIYRRGISRSCLLFTCSVYLILLGCIFQSLSWLASQPYIIPEDSWKAYVRIVRAVYINSPTEVLCLVLLMLALASLVVLAAANRLRGSILTTTWLRHAVILIQLAVCAAALVWMTTVHNEPLLIKMLGYSRALLMICFTLILLALPAAVPYLYLLRGRGFLRSGIPFALVTTIFVISVIALLPTGRRLPPWLPNILTPFGPYYPNEVILGEKPVILPPWLRLAFLGLVIAAASSIVVANLANRNRRYGRSPIEWVRSLRETNNLFILLYSLFAAAYVILVLPRYFAGSGQIFDRYLLLILPLGVSFLLECREKLSAQARLPRMAWFLLAAYGGYGCATAHDSVSRSRAVLGATSALVGAGIQRSNISAGFEFDAWTELERTGYINDGRIKSPPNAFRSKEKRAYPKPRFWFWTRTPSIDPVYFIVCSLQDQLCSSSFPPVHYVTWLPPRRQYILTQVLCDKASSALH